MPEKRVTAEQRQVVLERAHGCCEYCKSQARFATQSFSIEHIIPRQLGGETTLENLALACQGCNNHKYTKTEARDPVSDNVVPLYHPRQQRWHDHFAWNDDFTLVIGFTPIGRATLKALQLNREELVNLRRVLYAMGEHPPAEID
jgi:5-methylcytosine-specific restriction endonuclease McrA